jgi:hypothetical protein
MLPVAWVTLLGEPFAPEMISKFFSEFKSTVP